MKEKIKCFFKRKAADKRTFTKSAVKWLLILGCINGTLPFVLSAFDKEPVAEMGIAWITEIVAVVTGYLCKSYFETKQERKQALENFKEGLVDVCEDDQIVVEEDQEEVTEEDDEEVV